MNHRLEALKKVRRLKMDEIVELMQIEQEVRSSTGSSSTKTKGIEVAT